MDAHQTNDHEPTIVCENLWKIFGETPKDLDSLLETLDTVHLSKEQILEQYGLTVGVHRANFQIQKGEVFVIMGLSGSGKSTIVRCLNRLIQPTSGRVIIHGSDVTRMKSKDLRSLCREKMGMVFQNFALVPSRTVLQNVTLGLEIRKIPKSERLQKARDAIQLVGLSGWEDKYCKQLSGGMQQRVGLARALAGDPEILLMDEAFSALDPLIRKQMQDEFLKLVRIVDKTIVFITHDLDEGLKLGDRIAVMKDGKIVQIGTPEDIVMRPADDYVAEFVSAISRTKRETARHLVSDPEDWVCSLDDDPVQLLQKMRDQDYLGLLVIDDQEIPLGVLYRDTLRTGIDQHGAAVKLIELLSKDVITVDHHTGVDELVAKAARTNIPLAVLDRKNRLAGIIPRSSLLKELAEMI
jgi:glycine betaine/proline transport system ATP-binding protein